MSVVFANIEDETLTIAEEGKWDTDTFPPSKYEPVGIVVIPGEHGVLKDGSGIHNQCAMMSLVSMSYETPEVGTTSALYMHWGNHSLDISDKSDGLGRYDSINENGLINYQKVITTVYSSSNEARELSAYNAYIPRQKSIGSIPSRTNNPYAPSPYIGSDYKSGGYNPSYGTTSYDIEGNIPNIKNALADFKGIQNTKIMTDLVTFVDWKNTSSIDNSYSLGHYPAACCCARYHTTGTKAFKDCSIEELRQGAGFWYLPACGELGYIIPRLYDINDTINKLKLGYGVGSQLNTGGFCWSSSEYSSDHARYINVTHGEVGQYHKGAPCAVRAFCRLGSGF